MNGGELANMLTDGWAAIQGDALIELRKLEGAELSAVISDPPYASGGMSMGEKARSTRDKYTSFGEQGNPYPDFSGDALAQRAWTSFLHEIMAAARKTCKPGAVCALFVDWRQLPALQEGYQALGIEQEAHNIAIIQKRLSSIQQRIELPDGGVQGSFFS